MQIQLKIFLYKAEWGHVNNLCWLSAVTDYRKSMKAMNWRYATAM